MMYIENIFICISIPLFLSLIFIRGDMRKYMLFICIGMGMCVLSAYVSSFFMGYYHTDAVVAAIEDRTGLRRSDEASSAVVLSFDF